MTFGDRRDNGAYTQITMKLKRGQKIYAFVGSGGTASTENDCAGGYNGGGPALTCYSGPHGGSGGGATHISYVNNPIISDVIVYLDKYGTNTMGSTTYSMSTVRLYYGRSLNTSTSNLINYVRAVMRSHRYWGPYINNGTPIREIGAYQSGDNQRWFVIQCHAWNNVDQVIGVAAGGGGGRVSFPTSYAFGGANVGGPCREDSRDGSRPISANNMTGAGYARGSGMYAVNSSGGGGGWLGGYSTVISLPSMIQTSGGHCDTMGGGGTSYVKNDPNIISSFMLPGNDGRLGSGGAYQKPATEGVNGYIKVIKN